MIENGLGGWRLDERAVTPYVKDYDALEPPTWSTRWDTTGWGLLSLLVDDRRVGGAIVAVHTPGLWLLEGCDDVSLLLDIRIKPSLRGRGLGHHIFDAACAWAKQMVTARRVACFPDGWKRLSRMVDLINLCDFLNRADDDSPIVNDVRPLVQATLDDYA